MNKVLPDRESPEARKLETRPLKSWDEFRSMIDGIRSEYGKRKTAWGQEVTNDILYRGQADANWPLQTTLERWVSEPFSLVQYMVRADDCVNELESVTARKWNLPRWPDMLEKLKQMETDRKALHSPQVKLPCYDYLVYLRQHGFPSPLLDWTESPYIAAYFAYCDRQRDDDGMVAVYAFIEIAEEWKNYGGGPRITVQGPYVSTHSRHFAQKAWYTICTKPDAPEDMPCPHIFYPHESVFNRNDGKQDVLIQITMPARDRVKALRALDDYNINAFTLYGTEDALVKTMAIRQFDLRHG